MSTITKEQAQKIIEAADEIITALAGTNEDVHPDSDNMLHLWDDLNDRYAPPEVVSELARIALASLEAEPVAYIRDGFRADGVQFCGGIITAEEHERTKPALSDSYNWKHQPLFNAPPAPVSVPDESAVELLATDLMKRIDKITGERHSVATLSSLRVSIVESCRAAMLQGADGTITNEGTIPATQFKPLADLYEMQFDDGRTCAFHTDGAKAVQWLLACDGNKVQEFVKLQRYQEALSGNSPVIPDGWALVPEEPTHEMLEAGDEQFGTYDVYRRMIAAAPQQEVKQGPKKK